MIHIVVHCELRLFGSIDDLDNAQEYHHGTVAIVHMPPNLTETEQVRAVEGFELDALGFVIRDMRMNARVLFQTMRWVDSGCHLWVCSEEGTFSGELAKKELERCCS